MAKAFFAARADRDLVFDRYAALPTDTATIEDIAHCFRLILGRNPDSTEWAGHASRVGENLASVVASYLSSTEFANRNLLKPPSADHLALTAFEGFSIFTSAEDIAVGVHVAAGTYEPHVQKVFRQFLKPGMTALDIGANIGFFSLLSASIVGAAGKVISVEPNAFNVKLLEASRRASGFDHVEIHGVAADVGPGLLVLNTAHSNGIVSKISDTLSVLLGSTIVPAQSIDAIMAGRSVDLVKIDVEGAEFKALQGARETISRSKPVIVSEFSPGLIPEGGDAYLSRLLDHGYELGVIEPDGTITAFGEDAHGVADAFRQRNIDHIDIVATPR